MNNEATKSINTFSKGLNLDMAKTLYQEGNYIDANNITLLTDNGLSNVVVQNKKGNKLQFKFPSVIGQATYEQNGEYPIIIPRQENIIIIGGIEVDNYIFLFTTSNTVGNPSDSGYGQIWKCQIDLVTENTINALNGYELNAPQHLMYNRYLNFNLNNRPKIVAKYENQNYCRLYWTDGLNPLRSINTTGSLTDLRNIPQRTLNIVPEVNLDTPVITRLVAGQLPEGKYQVAYRLLSKEGVLTNFSTCSNLIDVIKGSEFSSELNYPKDDTIEYTTDTDIITLNDSEKGIEFYIDKLDNDYQMVQYALIYYSEPDVPEIYVYPYKEISLYEKQYDTVTDLYSDTFTINQEDFNILLSPFEVVKTLEVKENTLFVANTTNAEFKVDLDCRAYRYDASAECKTYELDGTVNTFTNVYPTDPKLDLINPYNDESGTIFGLNPAGTPTDWYNYHQYKFQADGQTPGGSGPNVSYNFTTNELIVDCDTVNQANKPPFVKTEPGTYNIPQNVPTHVNSNNGSFDSLKSPYRASCQVSWQRGEVYRFGITFYNKKGLPSYVNWIGDIKMPDFNEFNANYSRLSSLSGNALLMYSTVIDFNITIPQEVAEQISGFRIVYVQRENKDKTRFGTGITGGFKEFIKEPIESMTTEDLAALLTAICMTYIRRWIDNMGGSGSLLEDPFKIKEKLADKISQSLGLFIYQKLQGSYANSDRLTNPEHVADMVDVIFETITNQKAGLLMSILGVSNLIKLIGTEIILRIKEEVKAKLMDMFTKKVAGLHKNVLSLGNGFANTVVDGSNGQQLLLGYTISPIVDFNTYQYKYGDYLKPVQSFQDQKLINEIHRDTTVGIYNPIDSSAYIRKWYNGNVFNWASVADSSLRRINIKNQKVLIPGELLGSGFDPILNTSSNLDFLISNSYINKMPEVDASGNILNAQQSFEQDIAALQELTLNFNPSILGLRLARFSKGEKVLGIGDKKHIFTTDIKRNSSGLVNYNDNSLIEDESNFFNLLMTSSTDTIRTIDYGGDYTVSYQRPNNRNQYNGIGYTSRANNVYIPASEYFSLITRVGNKTFNLKANLGDSYVGVYGAVNYCYYYNQIQPEGYRKSMRTKKGMYEIFPCEADFNFTLREGLHVINNLSPDELEETTEFKIEGKKEPLKKFWKNIAENIFKRKVEPAEDLLRTKRFLLSDFKFNPVFNQRYNINTYIPESLIFNSEVDKYSNRIWHSKRKIDGELIDSWRNFQLSDYLDVEGTQGPIQEIVVNKNKLFFYQTNGIGIASTNERGQVTDSEGNAIVLSNGKLLARYDYITKETGTQHQFSVVNTNQAIYHYDANIRKLFKLGEGLECISDNLGLFSKLQTVENITSNDTTLNGIGVHAGYEIQNKTVYFTFLGETLKFTIGYNEKLGVFESFYDFKPVLYFPLNKKLFSSIQNSNESYWHDKGEYGNFYGTIYNSNITIFTNDNPFTTKVWDNQQFQTEVYDGTTLINLETIDKIRHRTENQDTGLITLIPQTNINKVERDWKVQIKRDTVNATYSTLSKPRLRDMYLETNIVYNNSDNFRFILHPITTFYRQSIH